MTDAPTNVINMQLQARLIRKARAVREKSSKVETADEIMLRLMKRGLRGEGQAPLYPGGIDDMELTHFYKPPGTCEICGSISPPNTKVCLACAVASEVDNMGV